MPILDPAEGMPVDEARFAHAVDPELYTYMVDGIELQYHYVC